MQKSILAACAAAALVSASAAVPGDESANLPYVPIGAETGLSGEATGFFHVERIEGRDWVVDPVGRAIVVTAIDHCRPHGWVTASLGRDLYREHCENDYPSKDAWIEETIGRLEDWGFNALANHCDEPRLRGKGLAHTITLYLGGQFTRGGGKDPDRSITFWSGPCTGMPNVFHPDFEKDVKARVQKLCAPERGNPWLMGWFLDNELKWWGPADWHKNVGLLDTVRALPPEHSARKALEKFLAGRKPDGKLREEFLALVAEKYFSTLCSAIREVDPDHMILGCRFAGPFSNVHRVVWEIAGKYCDIVSFNHYPWVDLDTGAVLTGNHGEPLAQAYDRIRAWAGKPFWVTEWSFPALDTGRPSKHGAGMRVRTQKLRAQATSHYLAFLLTHPSLVAHTFFMWLDQPVSGVSETFPEDSNYGLVRESGEPYEEVVSVFRTYQNDPVALREGRIPMPKGDPSLAVNRPTDRSLFESAAKNAAASGAAVAPVEFSRGEDGAWTLSNGIVTLRGRVGSRYMADEVSFGGQTEPVGRYGALLQWYPSRGGRRFDDITKLLSVDFALEASTGIGSVTLVGEGVIDGRSSSEGSFQTVHRLSLAPGLDRVLAEIVSLRNVGDAPVSAALAYMRPFAVEPEPKGMDTVPELWGGPMEAAWQLPDGRGFYISSADDRANSMRFWTTDGPVQHADARFDLPSEPYVMAPGQEWTPETPIGATLSVR